MRAGGGHVAFAASAKSVVHEFFAAALTAGAKSHGRPGSRVEGDECFNAAVLDFDGNSVEVVWHEGVETAAGSHLLTMMTLTGDDDNESDGRNVNSSGESADRRSTAGRTNKGEKTFPSAFDSARRQSSTTASLAVIGKTNPATGPSLPVPNDLTTVSVLHALQQSMMSSKSGAGMLSTSKIEISSRTLAGTLIGAAAGAAVAYAACKSEEDSALAELEFAAAMAARRSTFAHAGSKRVPRPPYNTSNESQNSRLAIEQSPMPLSAYMQSMSLSKAITYLPSEAISRVSAELAQQPTASTVTDVPGSVARSKASSRRSRSKAATVSTATTAKAKSVTRTLSKISSTTDSSCAKKKEASVSRRVPKIEGLVVKDPSHAGSKTKSEVSRHSTASKKSRHSATTGGSISKAKSKSPDIVTELDKDHLPPDDHLAFVNEVDEQDSVVPSDSISNVGSRKSRSRRPSKSKTSTRSFSDSSSYKIGRATVHRQAKYNARHNEVSDDDSIDTMTPSRYRRRSYASLPIRGITPSMINVNCRTVRSHHG